MKQILSEYPRPNLVRDSYICLNGEWEYSIGNSDTFPNSNDGIINVPYSIETKASGIEHILQPDEYLYYRLSFRLPSGFIKDKVILHFMAVDQIADVYLNKIHIKHHVGGYEPFEVEIKEYLKEKNELFVRVRDYTDTSYHARGKQLLNPSGIWYTPQSGIYMPVWLESVSNDYIKNIKVTSDIDDGKVDIELDTDSDKTVVIFEGKEYEAVDNKLTLKISNPKLWSPEDPHLYGFKVKTKNDLVESYFGMRKIETREYNGHKVIYLNNNPYFVKGLLDQGYYANGLYTPDSYDDYKNDIELAKSLGFNCLRKHIKVEAPMFYYLCDKLGMLVFQDFVSGGKPYNFLLISSPLFLNIKMKDNKYKLFRRSEEEGRKEFVEENKKLIKYLYNYPCVVLYTIFNEAWGQFDAKKVYEEISPCDTTRLYDHCSGWIDQGVSDVKSLHVYFKRVKMPKEKDIKDRAVILSECGAYQLDTNKNNSKGIMYSKTDDVEELMRQYEDFINLDILANIPKGLSCFIYTQLSDVETEVNGFVTFDRSKIKVDVNRIKELNDKAHY